MSKPFLPTITRADLIRAAANACAGVFAVLFCCSSALIIDLAWNTMYYPVNGHIDAAKVYVRTMSGGRRAANCIDVQYTFISTQGKPQSSRQMYTALDEGFLGCNVNVNFYEPSVKFGDSGRFKAGADTVVWVHRFLNNNSALIRDGLLTVLFWWCFVLLGSAAIYQKIRRLILRGDVVKKLLVDESHHT
jgi:hypothetical protein